MKYPLVMIFVQGEPQSLSTRASSTGPEEKSSPQTGEPVVDRYHCGFFGIGGSVVHHGTHERLPVAGFKRPITQRASDFVSVRRNEPSFVCPKKPSFAPSFVYTRVQDSSIRISLKVAENESKCREFIFCFSPETLCGNWGNGSLTAG